VYSLPPSRALSPSLTFTRDYYVYASCLAEFQTERETERERKRGRERVRERERKSREPSCSVCA
jgi:hypothetical protein